MDEIIYFTGPTSVSEREAFKLHSSLLQFSVTEKYKVGQIVQQKCSTHISVAHSRQLTSLCSYGRKGGCMEDLGGVGNLVDYKTVVSHTSSVFSQSMICSV